MSQQQRYTSIHTFSGYTLTFTTVIMLHPHHIHMIPHTHTHYIQKPYSHHRHIHNIISSSSSSPHPQQLTLTMTTFIILYHDYIDNGMLFQCLQYHHIHNIMPSVSPHPQHALAITTSRIPHPHHNHDYIAITTSITSCHHSPLAYFDNMRMSTRTGYRLLTHTRLPSSHRHNYNTV